MFGETATLETMAKAAMMKYDHIPRRLYKYRTFSDNHLSALMNGELYFTATDKLNDIKEANLVISKEAEAVFYQKLYDDLQKEYGFPGATVRDFHTISQIIEDYFRTRSGPDKSISFTDTLEYKALEEKAKVFYREQTAALQKEIRSMYSVCCFSARNNNNMMWTHYAEAHQGFCIEYDFKSLGDENLFTAYLFPVIYKDDTRIFIKDTNEINGSIGMLAATQKEKAWNYEEEWRLLLSSKADGTPQKMPIPTAIYLGERTSANDFQSMKDFCITNNIPLYQMRYNQEEDQIESIRL